MATAAMLVLRPFEGIASSSLARQLGLSNDTKLVLLHTGNNPKHIHYAERKIATLTNSHHNMVLLKHDNNDFSEDAYQVVYKNNIKTGIIKAVAGDKASSINELSAYLKKEKNCQLVVCISDLGYKNKNGLDDITLAEKSTHIDIIIGNHATNHTTFPFVTRNSRKEEVIIHSAVDNGFGLGNIEIGYDERTATRNSVSFNNLLTRLPETA